MAAPEGWPQQGQAAVCFRHRDRPTGLQCVRCGRPACPECLREASVGYQCVDCVRQGRSTVRRPTTVAGAPIRAGAAPVVTYTLIAVNVLLFVVTAVQARSLNNVRAPLFQEMVLFPGYPEQLWRVITAGFLHFGVIHIVLNMFALYIIGREVEVVLGRLRFLALYFVSLLGGGVAAYLLTQGGQTAGASGAVFGLMGALLVAVFRLKLDPKSVIFVIVLNLVISFSIQNVSWQGHIGGLVTGALLMLAMVFAPARSRTLVQAGAAVGIAVIWVLALVAGAGV